MLLWVQTCQSPVSLPLSFLSLTEAVISRKLKRHPRGGAGKWLIIGGPGSPLVSAPKVSKVLALREQSSTVSEHRGEREREQERASALKAAAQCFFCMSLLFFTRSHLPLFHSVAEYVREDQKSACGSWNLRVWHKIISARMKMCYRSRDFGHKYNGITKHIQHEKTARDGLQIQAFFQLDENHGKTSEWTGVCLWHEHGCYS